MSQEETVAAEEDVALYTSSINEVLALVQQYADTAAAQGSYKGVKEALDTGLRTLRELKRQVTQREQEIRAAYKEARLENSQTGRSVFSWAPKADARARAARGRRLSEDQNDRLAPLAELKRSLDDYIAHLSSEKSRLAAAGSADE